MNVYLPASTTAKVIPQKIVSGHAFIIVSGKAPFRIAWAATRLPDECQ
jgi:hypothetical protein